MDLLDRYLHAVRFWLPRAQKDDIIAELSEDIHSQVEDLEAALGRKLNEPELESILKQRGRPVFVASRYRPQQYLIGPALFPVYRFVVMIVAVCYLVPWLLTWIALTVFAPNYHTSFGRTFGPPWGDFWVVMFVAFGTVTLVFAIIERVKPRILEDWNPRTLPPAHDPNRIPRLQSVINLLANGIFIAWWVMDMWSTNIFSGGGVSIVLAPVWKSFLWTFLLIAICNVVLAAANLARPFWTWLRASFQLILTVAASVAFCWMCRVNILARIAIPGLSGSRAAEITSVVNLNLSRAFPFVVAACALIIVLSSVGRLIRLRTKRTTIMQGQGAALL